MNEPSFVNVKENVSQWIINKEEYFKSKSIITETITNSEDCLYLVLNFQECMAAIVVAEPDFAPYRFVSFEAVDIVNGLYKMVHAWYDKEGTTIEEINNNLNSALNIVIEYNKRKSK